MTRPINHRRLIGVAALAASTALANPLAAYAANRAPVIRLAQAETEAPADEAPAEAQQPAEPPAAEAPAPTEEAPAPAEEAPAEEPPAPAGEAAAPEPAPAAEEPAEPAEPPVSEPAPGDEPVPAEGSSVVDEPPAVDEAPAEEPAPDAAPSEAPSASDASPEATPEEAPSDEAQPQSESEPATPEAPQDDTAPDAAEQPDAAPSGEAPDEAEPQSDTSAPPADEPDSQPSGGDETQPPEESESSDQAPAAETPGETAPDAGEPSAPPASETPEAPGTPETPDARGGDAQAEAQPSPSDENLQTEVSPPALEEPQPVDPEIQNEPVGASDIAASDARVQALQEPVDVPSITAAEGDRIQVTDNSVTTINNTTIVNENNRTYVEQPLPPNVDVVEDFDGREILTLVGAGLAGAAAGAAASYFIRGDSDGRLSADADDVYYEELPAGRLRETIVRPNGTQVVTITDRYGEIVQRSRILPDGREVVLFYDPNDQVGNQPYYYDVGANLPPISVNIPRDEYIVDVSQPDEDLYYRTITAPPVETVERIYSVDEVRRSERVRDKVRRIDLSTINFDFGSAAISQNEVANLQALADAIKRVIDDNPSETFLVEGHTDAVGSDIANLALSDERASAVASALTRYFDVPAENLVTQGYGEQFLKVNTQEPNRENRRVTVRRITPLVKPVEISQAN